MSIVPPAAINNAIDAYKAGEATGRTLANVYPDVIHINDLFPMYSAIKGGIPFTSNCLVPHFSDGYVHGFMRVRFARIRKAAREQAAREMVTA